MLYCVLQRKYVKKMLFYIWESLSQDGKNKKKVYIFILIFTAISFALASSGPAKLIDTDWYHAQTIRWIEEFGCVKGVANLFYALGFNNAQHYFDALFSMKCFMGQSLRGTGGFFGFLLFAHGLHRIIAWNKHERHIADSLAAWEIVYTIIITAFYADPYTDTLPNILILFIMTEWIAQLEEKKKDIEMLAFYCILGVFATVAKTSAAMVVLVVIYPVYLLVKEKKSKQIIIYIIIGFLVTIPYFVTNIITTGYPIYLLTSGDFLNVPWKIDASVLKYSVDNMVQFARLPDATIEEALNCGLRWIPKWFMRESISHQILYLSILLFLLYDIVQIIIKCIQKKIYDPWMILPRFVSFLGILYWLFTIPQVKYCWAYLIIPVAVIPAYYFEQDVTKKKIVTKALMLIALGLMVLYSGFYGLRTIKYMKDGIKFGIRQVDYENHIFDSVEKNGHTFYTRIDGGDIVCGYYIFPYLDNKDRFEELVVGESLGDGFYYK